MSENIISRLTELENAITEALEGEDFAKAEDLSAKRNELLEELAAACAQADDETRKQELEGFAHALRAHYQQMSEDLQQQREQARQELMQLHRGQSGMTAYREVRRNR